MGGRRKQKESGEEFVGKILRQLTEWIEGQRLECQAWKRNTGLLVFRMLLPLGDIDHTTLSPFTRFFLPRVVRKMN